MKNIKNKSNENSFFQPGNKIIVNTHDAINIIDYNDILYLCSEGAYTTLYCKNEIFKCSKNLASFTKMLKFYSNFIRINRFYIINTNNLKKIIKNPVSKRSTLIFDNINQIESSSKINMELYKAII